MTDLRDREHLLLDLDDTLYVCAPGERAGKQAVLDAIARELAVPRASLDDLWRSCREAVKERLDGRGSSHSRLLYLHDLAHRLNRPEALPRVRSWERTYWNAFIDASRMRPRALPFLSAARAAGRRIALVSDLTLEVQLLKLERFGLFPLIDAIAISEEVPLDKPAAAIFELALARLGATAQTCVMVGDRPDKDGEGAQRLGIPFVEVPSADAEGLVFDELTRRLGIAARAT